MTPQYRLKRLTAYPDWHKKPFLLNRAELQNPYCVLTEFFDRYDLSQIRISLKQWLEDVLDGREAEADAHFYTHENIAKLVEAAWVIFEQRRQAKAAEGFEAVMNEGENDESRQSGEDGGTGARFIKWVPFTASLKAVPLGYMKHVFEIRHLDELKATIDWWQEIALTAGYERYARPEERADLLEYCKGLHRLVEAAYILERQRELETEGRLKWQLSDEATIDLLTGEQAFCLGEAEINDPASVFEAFYETFTPAYARRELWDMLACVVECEQEGLNKLDLLLDYECLHALLEAGWLFHQQPGKKEQANEKKSEAI